MNILTLSEQKKVLNYIMWRSGSGKKPCSYSEMPIWLLNLENKRKEGMFFKIAFFVSLFINIVLFFRLS